MELSRSDEDRVLCAEYPSLEYPTAAIKILQALLTEPEGEVRSRWSSLLVEAYLAQGALPDALEVITQNTLPRAEQSRLSALLVSRAQHLDDVRSEFLALEHLISISEGDMLMGYLVTRAERLADSGAPAEAIRTAWRHVLDIEPDHRDALRRLLEIADSDLERLEIHRKLADGYSHGSPPWQVHLQKAIELADGAERITLLEALCGADTAPSAAHEQLAEVLLEAGRVDPIIERYEDRDVRAALKGDTGSALPPFTLVRRRSGVGRSSERR